MARFAVLVGTVVLALWAAPSAVAHDEEPRLELGVERANPGASVTVRGSGFPYDASVALSIADGANARPAGTVEADVEGAFTMNLVLPKDLAAGTYAIRAEVDIGADHHVIPSLPFVVSGAPIEDGQDGDGRREEEDSLLAPIPSAVGAASSQVGVAPATPELATPAAATPALNDPSGGRDVLVGALGAVAILAGVVLARRMRTRAGA
jgi:methionine-rich copper-binding protein CopC